MRKADAVLAGQFPEVPGVVLDEQVVDGHAHVPEEPLGDFQALHDPARHHREERQRVVAAQPLEFLAELGRPVLRADLPAVDMGRDQRLGSHRPASASPR